MNEYIFVLAGMVTAIATILLLECIEERRRKADEQR